jgi:hypothetical protein
MIATLTTNKNSPKKKKHKNKNIDPSPSLIKGPHANNPFTAALAFLAAL